MVCLSGIHCMGYEETVYLSSFRRQGCQAEEYLSKIMDLGVCRMRSASE